MSGRTELLCVEHGQGSILSKFGVRGVKTHAYTSYGWYRMCVSPHTSRCMSAPSVIPCYFFILDVPIALLYVTHHVYMSYT